MLRIDELTSYQVSVMVYILSILIRNSGEILINFHQNTPKIKFILSLVEVSSTMRGILMILVWCILVYGLMKVFIMKRATRIFQLYTSILGPLLIWMSCAGLSSANKSVFGGSIFYGINLGLGSLILLILPYGFNERFNFYHLRMNNSVTQIYETLLAIDYVALAVMPLIKIDDSVMVGAMVVVKLIRSGVYLTRVNYESPMVEYCGVLSEISSWVGVVAVMFSLYLKVDSSSLIWINCLLIVWLTVHKSTLLLGIVEMKSLKALDKIKETLIEQLHIDQNYRTPIPQEQLLQLLAVFTASLKQNDKSTPQWTKITFSAKLLNETLQIRQLLVCISSGVINKSALFDLSQNIIIPQQNAKSKRDTTDLLMNKQEWDQFWTCTQKISELSLQKYCGVRNFIVYAMPVWNIKCINRLMYLDYLTAMNCNDKSFLTKTRLQIVYSYLTERIFLQYEFKNYSSLREEKPQKKLQKQRKSSYNHNIENGNIENNKYSDLASSCQTDNINVHPDEQFNVDCLFDMQQNSKTSKFDLYYRQTINEKHIQTQFHSILSINNLILSKTPSKTQLLQLMIQKNNLKTQLQNNIQQLHSTCSFKSAIYKYIFESYINNSPHIAIYNLKEKGFEQLIHQNNLRSNKNILTKKTLKNKSIKYLQSSSQSPNDENKMIIFISGMVKFGQILHSCKTFKQKMQVQSLSGNVQSLQNLSIYNIMLPLWTSRHMAITKQSKKYNIHAHQGNKYHILSLAEKHVYEIDFRIHIIVRKMDDLLFGIDISYRPVEKLLVYRGSLLVFESWSDKYREELIRTMKSLKLGTIIKKKKVQNRKVNDNLQQFQGKKQTLFGEEYMIYRRYKRSRGREKTIDRQLRGRHNMEDTLDNMSNNPQSTYRDTDTAIPSIERDSNESTSTMRNHQMEHNEKLNSQQQNLKKEISIREYCSGTLFNKSKLSMFTIAHWGIPPMIFLVSFFVRWYSLEHNQTNTSIYSLKLLLQNQFLLQDTHILNTLTYVNQLNIYQPQTSSQTENQLKKIAIDVLNQTLTSVTKRKETMSKAVQKHPPLLDVLFKHIDTTQFQSQQSSPTSLSQRQPMVQSLFYSSTHYEIMFKQYLASIHFDQFKNNSDAFTLNQLFPSTVNLQRLLAEFKHRYEFYFGSSYNENSTVNSNNGANSVQNNKEVDDLFSLVNRHEDELNSNSITFLTYFLISVAAVAFITGILFVIIYLDLEYHIQKLVLKCIHFPSKMTRKIQHQLEEAKSILQNAYENSPIETMKRLQNKYLLSHLQHSKSTCSLSRKSLIPQSKHLKYATTSQTRPYFTRKQVFKHSLRQILFFLIILGVCEFLMIEFITTIISSVQLIDDFSQGTQKLSQITAISNEITMEMTLAMSAESVEEMSSYRFDQKLSEFIQIDKLHIIETISPGESFFMEYTFMPMCSVISKTRKPYQCQLQQTLSYSQCMSDNLKVFKLIHKHLDIKGQKNLPQLQTHLFTLQKHLSILNSFTREVLQQALQNYEQIKLDPTVYLDYLIAEMLLIIIVFNWFTYEKLYRKMAILYKQTFTLCTVQQMNKLPNHQYFLNQSKNHRLHHFSGQFQI